MRIEHPESIATGEDLAYPLPATPIERRSAISREEFAREFKQGIGRPVIVQDGMDSWRARKEWTFDFFAERYADRIVTVTDRLVRPTQGRRISMREYMLYCQMPFATALGQVKSPTPFYLTGFSPLSWDPALLEFFDEPYFVENSYRQMQGPMLDWYYDNFSWIFIGPKGTLSPLHVDLFGTHAWLAQIQGRKHFLLFSPEDAGYLYNGAVDLLHPDLDAFPLIEKARPVEAILEPGEVIYIPAGWSHQVISLEPSISITMNYVGPEDFARHLTAICRDLPVWLKRIDTPAFREANRIAWTARDLAPSDALRQSDARREGQ